MALVTLLSDFGTQDGFVASMKGVILDIAPDAGVVDVAHDIAPGDVEAGAWVLGQYWKLFPPGTVHVAVIDPGVGSDRLAIAAQLEGRYIVTPDNGLITHALSAVQSYRCVQITEPRFMRSSVAPTFHGRDVFAPVAAHLERGVRLEELGPPLQRPTTASIEPPTRGDGELRGRIAHVDRFGNLISDIPESWVDDGWRFEVAGKDAGFLRGSYSDVGKGEVAAVIGSMGTVEIAVRESSAAKKLGATRGDHIVARRSG